MLSAATLIARALDANCRLFLLRCRLLGIAMSYRHWNRHGNNGCTYSGLARQLCSHTRSHTHTRLVTWLLDRIIYDLPKRVCFFLYTCYVFLTHENHIGAHTGPRLLIHMYLHYIHRRIYLYNQNRIHTTATSHHTINVSPFSALLNIHIQETHIICCRCSMICNIIRTHCVRVPIIRNITSVW